ncbi:hypothetical protein [Streptomyces sp. NPDC055099]
MRDIDGVLSPTPSWLWKWRFSKNRAQARRTLRSMMRIYCPDLLATFEEATESRGDWVAENRGRFNTLAGDQTPHADLEAAVVQMRTTCDGLHEARNALRAFITENYPRIGGEAAP